MELRWVRLSEESGHEAGRRLLKEMYQEHFGNEMPEILLESRGKPYFFGYPVHFSISHTRHHAFCVFSQKPVGIDAEETDRIIRPELAEKILSPKEKERYASAPDKNQALLRLWVLKEAAGKCTGEGINGYPNHTDFDPNDPRIREIAGCYVAIVEM